MNQILGIFIAIIVIVAVVIWWTGNGDESSMVVDKTTGTQGVIDGNVGTNDIRNLDNPPVGYRTIDNVNQISMIVPNDAVVRNPNPNTLEVTYMEEASDDGFEFIVRRDEDIESNQTLEDYAQLQVDGVRDLDMEIVDSLTTLALEEENAYHFSYESDSDFSTTTNVIVVLPEGSDAGYTIDYSVSVSNRGTYLNMIQGMLRSLYFHPETGT